MVWLMTNVLYRSVGQNVPKRILLRPGMVLNSPGLLGPLLSRYTVYTDIIDGLPRGVFYQPSHV
jgi:hypothetical protein